MNSSPNPSETVSASNDAALVLRSGPREGERVELSPQQLITLGRAPTNRIVVSDEICSRNHCELFFSSGRWFIRDLGSRNGTRVQGELITGDVELRPGETIQLGSTLLVFVWESQSSGRDPLEADTATNLAQMPEILERAPHNRYRSAAPAAARDRESRDLGQLYRLALEMGNATNMAQLAGIVLEALLEGTRADIGAVLILPAGKPPKPKNLNLVGYKSRLGVGGYQQVSEHLTNLVISDQEAVLARDLHTDQKVKFSKSLSDICAQSVVCAPIKSEGAFYGVIHLYCMDLDNPLKRDDLDFTIAVADQLAVAVGGLGQRDQLATGLAQAVNENQTLREQLQAETELVGASPLMIRLRERILRIAPTGATVLIRGESGVGKELVARAIHTNSKRRDGAFVTMNCAALSESLLESELFGHEKGAFTGAVGRKIGKFEQAHGGTIFLDEVGEMSPAIQAKFLRVLEGHAYERVGGGVPVQVDVRVVAATNRDLEKSVAENEFRQDLYFRLQVVELFVEPLRERQVDIPVLANYFLQKFARKTGRAVTAFSEEALDALVDYHWPGNVRELQNTIERAVILCADTIVERQDIQLSALGAGGPVEARPYPVESPVAGEFRAVPLDLIEQEHILAMLEWTGWNKSQAAQLLGIERSTLDRKLKRYDVERPAR